MIEKGKYEVTSGETDGTSYRVWADASGVHISVGDEEGDYDYAYISWYKLDERREEIENGN
ncbi:MAG: hypothetical protein M3R38_01795 [Actinomycetota bacterium]|nr:hypothetical protein [Actinomycetota bacterium]